MPTAQAPGDPQPLREQLERILNSAAFAGSQRASAFLRYIVEETLRSPGAPIKETIIGVDVFGKEPAFDPKVDPIVRIYAGRVRQRLERYYETEGQSDSIRIEIPKRSYVPEFHSNLISTNKIHVLPVRIGRVRPWKAIAAATLLVVAVYLGTRVVVPARNGAPTVRQLTFDAGLTTDPALAPNGDLLAFASDRGGRGDLDIWIRQPQGGEPIRLTNSPENDREPSFSPDGTKIAFHSNREGGGLYVMPALGGESSHPARKIASGGRRPRFSPDGKWIAYVAGSAAFASVGSVYLVEANGGNPRNINGPLSVAGYPVWHPDGRRLLVLGAILPETHVDWYVVPIHEGSVQAVGARKYLETGGWLTFDDQPLPDAWKGEEVYFTSRPSVNVVTSPAEGIWKLRLTSGSWLPNRAERLTRGSGHDVGATVGESGRIVFSGLRWSRDLFELASGKLTKVLSGTGQSSYPSLSKDGSRLAYTSSRSGESQIWLRETSTGKEDMLTEDKGVAGWSRISPDGTKVAYVMMGKKTIVMDIEKRDKMFICEACTPVGWSANSKILSVTLEQNLAKIDSGFFSVADKKEIARFQHPQYSAMAARFSPDGRWVALNVKVTESIGILHVIPWTGEPVPVEKWTAITKPSSSAHFPEWSPEGQSVYYYSNQLGSFDLWRTAVSEAGHPEGEPVLIRRLGSGSLNPGRRPLPYTVGPHSIVLSLEQTIGNLWTFN